MEDGYLNEKQRSGQNIDLDHVTQKYRQWTKLLMQISYWEEYLDGRH